MLLRPVLAHEVTDLARLQARARAAAPMPASALDTEALARDLASGLATDHLWLAEAHGAALGYVRFVTPDAERVGWLDDLYVDPAAAGQGSGSALLDLVKAYVPTGFGLWTFESNLPARAFYAGHGLREVERVDAADSPTGESELRMHWSG